MYILMEKYNIFGSVIKVITIRVQEQIVIVV